MRWAQRARMQFIADTLANTGRVNRSDLIEAFEISNPQASTDFRLFMELHPGAMTYDSSRKTYVPHTPIDPDKGKDTQP